MRRSLPIALLLLALALVLVAGCGGDDAPVTQSTITVTPTTSPTSTTTREQSAPASDAGAASDSEGQPGAEPAPADRPRSVAAVTAAVLTGSRSPVLICDTLVTAAYVKTAYGARQGCIAAQQPGTLARAVRVSEVTESGDTATAVAVPSGGPYDGVDVAVQLVAAPDLDGAWQVDSLVADVPAGP